MSLLRPMPPVFLHALHTTVVRPRWFLLRTILAATLALVAIAAATVARAGGVDGGAAIASAVSLSAIAMAAVGPSVGALSLVEDRLRGTLTLLLCSPITAFGLAAQRFGAAFLVTLGIAAVGLPALAWIHGILAPEPHLLVTAGAGLTAVALELTAWSVAASAWARGRDGAVLFAYLLPAARWLGQHGLADAIRGGHPVAAEFLRVSTPIPFLVTGGTWFDVSTLPMAAPAWLVAAARRPWWIPVLPQLLIVPAALALAAAGLRRGETARAGTGRAFRCGAPRRAAGEGGRTRWPGLLRRSPIAWKDLASGAARGGVLAWSLVASAILVTGWFTMLEPPFREGRGAAAFGWLAQGAIVLAAAAAAAAGTADRRSETLDLLRASPLTPDEIAAGKVHGLALRLCPVLVAFLMLATAAAVHGRWHPAAAALSLAFVALALANAALFSLRWGTRCERPRLAVPGATLAAAGSLLACPLAVLAPLAAVVSEATARRGLGGIAGLMIPAATLGPVPFIVECIDTSVREIGRGVPGGGPGISPFLAVGWGAANALAVILWHREIRWLLRETMRAERDLGDAEDAPELPVGERLARLRRRRERERALDAATRVRP